MIAYNAYAKGTTTTRLGGTEARSEQAIGAAGSEVQTQEACI